MGNVSRIVLQFENEPLDNKIGKEQKKCLSKKRVYPLRDIFQKLYSTANRIGCFGKSIQEEQSPTGDMDSFTQHTHPVRTILPKTQGIACFRTQLSRLQSLFRRLAGSSRSRIWECHVCQSVVSLARVCVTCPRLLYSVQDRSMPQTNDLDRRSECATTIG